MRPVILWEQMPTRLTARQRKVRCNVFPCFRYTRLKHYGAASDVYAPISLTVAEINEALSDEPETVHANAETDAQLIKIELSSPDETGDLMGADAYKAHCEAEES
mmetsp:Transcript_41784/g.61342  ORF Transcript_41784/g.61342 Transcript_41784/m.61342 type:complete len:105 (+) Transcript_41784:25-339(+)